MPHATPCLDCGRPVAATELKRGRCPICSIAKNQTDFYQSPEWRRVATKAKSRPDAACAICGGRKRLIAHHSHARRDGGPDIEENIVLLCGEGAIGFDWASCHSQYEADKRRGKETWLLRMVDAL